MRVTLINPPYTLDEVYENLEEVGNIMPPLGLAYVAAMLEKRGHMVKILDAPALGLTLRRLLDTTCNFRPDLVGITSTTPEFSKARTLSRHLKDRIRVHTVIGGPHVSAAPNQTISDDSFDFGIIGEGELTIVELIEKLQENKLQELDDVDGIIYRKDGNVHRTAPRSFILDLDSLPLPARHLLPALSAYHPTPATYKRLPLGTMITSRGCPYSCSFCDKAVFGNKFRARSPKNVVEEMKLLMQKHGAKEVRFWDDTFNIDTHRVTRICEEMMASSVDVPWTCLARVNNMNEQVLKAMKKAGCWQISYGIESGNQEVLDSIRKDLNLDVVRKVVRMTKHVGISTRGFFMLALPGDTEETMRETINFAKRLELDVAHFYLTIPFPGTELFAMAQTTGELTSVDWEKYFPNFPDEVPFTPAGLNPELIKRYQRLAYRDFYLRPKHILKQLLQIRSFGDIRRYFAGFQAIRRLKDE